LLPQAKLRNMEKQVEWVKAERDELTANAGSEARELSARLKEGEAALARLKVGPRCSRSLPSWTAGGAQTSRQKRR